MKPLLIRADASRQMGTGHVMRCLALAQAWKVAGGSVTFWMGESTPAVEQRLRSGRFEISFTEILPGSVADADKTATSASELGAEWVVVDGYQFGAQYQSALKAAGLRVLFVDDNGHAEDYCADLVLNHNLHADENLYRTRDSRARLLLGPRYSMLRRDFSEWRAWKRDIPQVACKVLVTMGGSDPDNVTPKIVESLDQINIHGLKTKVIVGGSNPNRHAIEAAAGKSRHEVECLFNVDDMPRLMAWADVAVAAAGTTAWEMCFLGLPAVLIDLAENQTASAATLARAGIARHGGKGTDIIATHLARELTEIMESPAVRKHMSERARATVDGYGSDRVVAFLDGTVSLRPASRDDCRQVWSWANDPVIRAASFASAEIQWEQHTKWFAAQLADPDTVFYIGVDNQARSIGQIRFRLEVGRATVSISLGTEFRGRGNGFRMLTVAANELWNTTQAVAIDAYVKPDNDGSIRLFRQAGFQEMALEQVQGQPALRFELKRHGQAD